MQRFRGELVFKAHRLLYHSTLGLRVIRKNKKFRVSSFRFAAQGFGVGGWWLGLGGESIWFRVSGFGFRVEGEEFMVSGFVLHCAEERLAEPSFSGFRVWGFGSRVSGFGSRVQDSGFRVQGVLLGCGVRG